QAYTQKYTVTWNNWDNELLEKDERVPYGDMPVFNGSEPTKQGNAQYTYTFVGWDATLAPVTKDVTYTAVFSETVNEYTVIWADEDGTGLETDENVPYGTMPQYNGTQPTKTVAGYTVTFAGWTPNVDIVTGDATYTATYSQQEHSCTITYVAETGGSVSSGSETVAVDTGSPAGSVASANSGWEFIGWYDEQGSKVGDELSFVPTKGDGGLYEAATYTAKFRRQLLDLTIVTTCDMANAANGEQGFLFTVTGTPDDTTLGTVTLTVSLVGDDSVTIKNLPVGLYTVKPANDWPWRFAEQADESVVLRTESKTVTFDYADPTLQWLSGHADSSWKLQ
ncbi:MAG: hypothetical protein IJC61_06050, partial [Oscillospiraceae bacterium]|nr:hypothetical protein [Oscillospiraceae bacterium]